MMNVESEETNILILFPKTQKSGIEKYIVLKVTQVIFPSQ